MSLRWFATLRRTKSLRVVTQQLEKLQGSGAGSPTKRRESLCPGQPRAGRPHSPVRPDASGPAFSRPLLQAMPRVAHLLVDQERPDAELRGVPNRLLNEDGAVIDSSNTPRAELHRRRTANAAWTGTVLIPVRPSTKGMPSEDMMVVTATAEPDRQVPSHSTSAMSPSNRPVHQFGHSIGPPPQSVPTGRRSAGSAQQEPGTVRRPLTGRPPDRTSASTARPSALRGRR